MRCMFLWPLPRIAVLCCSTDTPPGNPRHVATGAHVQAACIAAVPMLLVAFHY